MAVEDKYVNADLAAGNYTSGALGANGDKTRSVVAVFETAAADDDGSIYRVANVTGESILLSAEILNDVVTSGTDWDFGIYDTLNGDYSGAVVVKDVYANGADLSTGHIFGAELSALTALGVEEAAQPIWEQGGHTSANKRGSYDLALTANTVGSSASTIVVKLTFLQS